MKRTKVYTSWDQLPAVLDVPLVCVVLGKSSASIKRYAADGILPGARKIGNEWRFDKETLMQYLKGAAP
jgi:predicted DNA-binding transcriptional regulator AlpA